MAKTLLALAAVAALALACAASDVPSQIHVTFGNRDGSSMRITWITNSEVSDSRVRFGDSTSSMPHSVAADPAFRYNFTSLYIPTTYVSGFIHTAVLAGLPADSTIFYICGSDSMGWSDVYSFYVPRAVGPQTYAVLNIIGDLGQTNNSAATMAHVLQDSQYSQTVIIGDLSYADSSSNATQRGHGPCTQERWDSWGRLVQPMLATRPLLALPGNHEIEQEGPPPATQTQFLAYTSRFHMPYEESGSGSPLFYSFRAGPAHVFMLNSYSPFGYESPQYKWFHEALKAVDRSVTPWVVVCLHAPWYSSNSAHQNEPEEVHMREAMEPLVYKYKVDLIFAGHVHAYERTYPLYKGARDSAGPTYINVGDGGNREGLATKYLDQPAWSAYREALYGHGRLQFFNATHARWAWHTNDTPEASVSDSVYLIKDKKHGLVAVPAL